jgi:DNA-binding NarL/FixJ family response regulator
LLALYTELGVELGMRRTLQRLMDRDITTHGNEAQWALELVFMTEAALALNDADVARALRPVLAAYAGKNLMAGTLIATFGSADRLLGRVAALLGDYVAAERHLDIALEMDRRMHSVVHTGETLAYQSLLARDRGQAERSNALAAEARALAGPIGHQRVLALLERAAPSSRPAGLSEREVDVLRLVAEGLSNQEIGARLHISANTAANHVRSILTKTGAANRTQAAIFAAQNDLA